MLGQLAEVSDVEIALVRPLTVLENQYVPGLLVKASDLLRQAAPSIDDRLARWNADSTDRSSVAPSVVATVVAGCVKRYLSNPSGAATQTETVGPFAKTTAYALRSEKEVRGYLQITADDLAALFPNRKRLRAGTIRTRPALAGRPVGRYGPLPTPAEAFSEAVTWSPDVRLLDGEIDFGGAGSSGAVSSGSDGTDQQILATVNNIQEIVMAYTPASADVTKISGAVIPIASSASSVQLTAGRPHEVTGSAAQTLTAPASPVNGTIVNVKVADAYTGPGVTMPTGMTQAGVLTAGQDFTWQWDGTGWNIQ